LVLKKRSPPHRDTSKHVGTKKQKKPEVRRIASDIEAHWVKGVAENWSFKVTRNRQIGQVHAQTALDGEL
jgi:hypothetical protein